MSSSSSTSTKKCDCPNCSSGLVHGKIRPVDKRNAAMQARKKAETLIISKYNIPIGKEGCAKCAHLTKKMVTFLKTFLEKETRMTSFPKEKYVEFMTKIDDFLDRVKKLACIDHLYEGQQLFAAKNYILCPTHSAVYKPGSYYDGFYDGKLRHVHVAQKLAKSTIKRMSKEDVAMRQLIQTGCRDCSMLRGKLNMKARNVEFGEHHAIVDSFSAELSKIEKDMKTEEYRLSQEKKAVAVSSSSASTASSASSSTASSASSSSASSASSSSASSSAEKEPLLDGVALTPITEEEQKENKVLLWHQSRKGDKAHACTKDSVFSYFRSELEKSGSFELKPKISGNGKSKKTTTEYSFCIRCPCHDVAGSKCIKCDKWVSVDAIFRKLSIVPSDISKKAEAAMSCSCGGVCGSAVIAGGGGGGDLCKKTLIREKRSDYISMRDKLKEKTDYNEAKLRRNVRYPEVLQADASAVLCQYCDLGIAVAFRGERRADLALDEFRREQRHVRKCDSCDIVFCSKPDHGGKMCGVRYNIGTPYGDGKDKPDHTDHRKKNCGVIRALQADDPHLAELARNARSCPKCEHTVARIDGCNAMMCICTEHFCWLCGQGFGRDNRNLATRRNLSDRVHTHSAGCSGAKGDYFYQPKK